MENTKETKGKETQKYDGEQKTIRKLSQVDATSVESETIHNIDGALGFVNNGDSWREKDSQENMQDSKERNMNDSSCSGSVAYISETLIMQITKEQRFDLIKSLTIHLPKDKMNKKIKYIENLEKLKRLQSLNLSNNMIEKMQKLESLVELRELNLANNCLKVIECLDNLVKLQVLNLGGNQITSIPGPTVKKLRCLKVLKLSHNKLETLLDITRLRPLQDLTNLDLQGNPFTSLPHYRQFVIFQLRSLDILDNQTITKEERLMADQRFAQEEVQRLEAEISKQEKLYQSVQNEKNEAKMMVENLTKTQKTLKAKVSKQTDRVKELEQDIEAKNGLLKAKNSDLIKASEKQYRLEQELAFYKLDAKFEMLGQMSLPEDSQMDDEDGLEDSSYIGKATFKRNQFIQESNNANPERVTHMRSLQMKYEEDEKMRDRLDQELQEKRQMIMQLEDQLEQLSQDVEEKNDQLRDTSEKLASLELSLASQMASFGQGNDLAKKQLAEKIEFIKRLQAAAEELEKRMNVVANDVAEKQKELEELRRKAAETGNNNDDDDAQSDLCQALNSKETELQDAYAQLSKMKEDLEMLKNRIAEEQAQVEMLREQLGKDETMSEKAMNQLKKELEGVIGGLNERLGELQNLGRKQQARVVDLEKERDRLEDELTKRDDMEGNVDLLQRQLDDAERALEDEQEKRRELEERERELQGQLSALDKNNNLDLIEARSKLRHANEENEKKIKKLKDQIENERKAAKDRVQRDEERVAKALEAARTAGAKEKQMKGLALQVDALKATNEALNDRLEETEDELRNRERDSVEKDELLQRLKDLLNDVKEGKKEVRQPVGHTDGVGQCLADLHKKYLELAEELELERQNGKHKQKQAKAAIDTLKAELAQCQSQLNAAEKALAELSKDGTEHDEDMKSLEDNVYRLQEGLRNALDKAEDEGRKRKRDAKAYKEKIQALEDEIGRLQDELNEEREQEADELNHVRSLAEKQKDHLENEIGELQNEQRKLKDKHRQDLKRKNEKVAELEALLFEKDKLLSEEKNRKANALERELEGLRRLVSDQTKATQDSINKEMETKRVHRKLEDTRRKIDTELKTAENKIYRLEQLLDSKDQQIQASRRRGFELDDTITALTGELEALKREMARYGHDFDDLASTVGRLDEKNEQDEIPRPKIHHHIYNHNTPPVKQDLQTVHQHHHMDNTSPVLHQTREHTVSFEVSPSSGIDQVHHHHHYGNGDFTLDLKKKKSRKKDLCNVLEHEDLEDDVMVLEEELARANSELSSQKTENKLNVLRSDLQDLEQTVSKSVQLRMPVKGLESQLDETLARFQDHLLTLMDHRTTLLSQKK